MPSKKKTTRSPWIVALSGASGMPYAVRLLQVLSGLPVELHIIVSEAATRVLRDECGIHFSYRQMELKTLIGLSSRQAHFYHPGDIAAPIASGSFPVDGMVIIPCSMNTLAATACGISGNLIQRAADVTLKEGRKLVLVPRETPLSAIHLKNMLRMSRAGAVILPAMPGFYHRPVSLPQLVDMLVMKVLDHMGLPSSIAPRWPATHVSSTRKRSPE